MSTFEKVLEEGYAFINEIAMIPMTLEDYLPYKSSIDLLVKKYKEEREIDVNRLGWEMKHIFPDSCILTNASTILCRNLMTDLLTITTGKRDNVFQILGTDTFAFKLDRLTEKIESYLQRTLQDENKRATMTKLCATALDQQSKLVIGIAISPELFLVAYSEVFPEDWQFVSPDNGTCETLIDYGVRLGNDENKIKKLFIMCNCILSGLSATEIENIDGMIQTATDETGNYSEILAMQSINEYFGSKKRVFKKLP